MAKSVLIIASDGSEEIELITTADVLRRAGLEVSIAGIQDRASIQCAQKTSLNVDTSLCGIAGRTFDAVVMPGGQPGTNQLSEDARVGEILRRHEAGGKLLGAICAAPLAFKSHGIAKGGTVTSYPSVKNELVAAGYNYSDDDVCVWENVVTSRGPGTAFAFALKIAERLVGAEKARSVGSDMLVCCCYKLPHSLSHGPGAL